MRLFHIICLFLLLKNGMCFSSPPSSTKKTQRLPSPGIIQRDNDDTSLIRNLSPVSNPPTASRSSFEERIQSGLVAVTAVIGGSLILTPFSIIKGIFGGFSAGWEFETDTLALSLALFGLVYRYSCRDNERNYQQQSGVVGAFAITRALAKIKVPTTCTPFPLDCGPPFHYFAPSMLFDGLGEFAYGILAFGGTAFVLEVFFKSGLLSKVKSNL